MLGYELENAEKSAKPVKHGRFAATVFTIAVFLAPALLAPGPVELANVAGIGLAVWMGSTVWRRYGEPFHPGSLAFRITSVAPGVIASAALLFAVALVHGWLVEAGEPSPNLDLLVGDALRLWSFPHSPMVYYLSPIEGLGVISDETRRIVVLTLTLSLVLGGFLFLLTFLAPIRDYDTLRRHALVWRGVKLQGAAEALAARGARGLRPLRDPSFDLKKNPVAGRLFFRSFAMLFFLGCLAFAPFSLRLLEGMNLPYVQPFFSSPMLENAFFPLWFAALWGICMVAAFVHIAAYLRLGFLLARG